MSSDDVPTGDAPPTPSPEYLAESIQPTIRGVTWMSVAVPLVFVLARVYCRGFLRKVFGIDDWLIVLAMAILLSYGAVIEACVSRGLGRHLEWVLLEVPENAIPVALLGQVSQPLVIMSCAMGKTSFSFTLLRIGTQRWMKITLWFLIITMNALHILVSILLFWRCQDPRVLWDPSVETTCWPVNIYLNIMFFIGSYSAATDFVLAGLPWAMLWGLNMKKKEKFGVAFAMSLGFFAGATAIVKSTKLPANSTSTDPTYEVGELLLWAGAENALIIIAACVPALRPILRLIFESTIYKYKNSDQDNSHQLNDLSNDNNNNLMLRPKKTAGQWTALIESELQTTDQASDHNSDKSILKQHNSRTSGDQQVDRDGGESTGRDESSGPSSVNPPPKIVKKMQVDVVYGTRSEHGM